MKGPLVTACLAWALAVSIAGAQGPTTPAPGAGGDGLSTAANCVAAATVLRETKPNHPNLPATQQAWTRIFAAIPGSDEARRAARQGAETMYVDFASRGPRLRELAAVGFIGACEGPELQTRYLARFGSADLKATVGLIDAGVCVAAAEFMVANDPVNRPAAELLLSKWTSIMSAINADPAVRAAVVIRERGTLQTAQGFSAGNELYVAQQFASSMCAGRDRQVLYLTRWGSPALMDAAMDQRR